MIQRPGGNGYVVRQRSRGSQSHHQHAWENAGNIRSPHGHPRGAPPALASDAQSGPQKETRPFARRIGHQENRLPDATLSRGRQTAKSSGRSPGLGFSLRPAFPRFRGGLMGRRPPLQLRGSAGFSPASRSSDAATIHRIRNARSQPSSHSSLKSRDCGFIDAINATFCGWKKGPGFYARHE